MKERDEDNTHLSISCRRYRCSQKLGELEKNGNCSSPVGEEDGTARRDIMRQVVSADENGTAQRNVRDLSVYLFVNEGDETR